VNWLVEFVSPIARALAEHLVNGLILSAAIYSAFLVVRPLFFDHRRGSAATSHRVLSLVFLALAFTPIVTCLQPVRGEMDAPAGPRRQAFKAGPSSPESMDAPPDDGQVDKKEAVDPEIIALLKNSALNDSDPRVREEAVASLVTIENDQATEALLQLLDDSKEDRTKVFILRTLSRRRSADPRIREKLSEFAARNQSLPVRLAALDQLGKNADGGAVDQLIAIYRSATEQPIKGSCLCGLARIGSKPARDFLIATAKDDPDPDLRRVALRVLVGPPERGHRILIRRDGAMTDGIELETLGKRLDGLNRPPEGPGEPETLMPDRPGLGPKSALPIPPFSPPIPPLPPLPNGPELQPNG
jgi:HEAT repeat protein